MLYFILIIFCHSFEGPKEEVLNEIVQAYNLTADHPVELTKNKDCQPHILQISQPDTYDAQLGSYIPVDTLIPLDLDAFLKGVRKLYSTPYQKMPSLPWDANACILYYNKELLPNPPQTFDDIKPNQLASAFPLIDLLLFQACQLNIPFATFHNGYESTLSTRLVFAGKPELMYHYDRLNALKIDYTEEAFTSGRCPLLLQEAKLLQVPFEIGYAKIPQSEKDPSSLPVTGSSLWVAKAEDGVAEFLTHLNRPEIQAEWAVKTGSIPVTKAAFKLARDSLHPAALTAYRSVNNRPLNAFSWGIRLPNQSAIWQQLILTQGLKAAMDEANTQLDQFENHYYEEHP